MMRRLLALACALGAAGWVTSFASAADQLSHTCANNALVSIVHGITVNGGKASVDYNVPAGCGSIELSLVSYQAPSSTYDPSTADQQVLYKSVTQTVPEGAGTLTVDVPNCYFQVDFVYGQPIEDLGPAGSDNFYNNSHESRLIQGLMGGTSACTAMQAPVCPPAANSQVTPMGQTTFAGNMATISFTVAAGCTNVKV